METDEFWKGEFGDEYAQRQKRSDIGSEASNVVFFSNIFMRKNVIWPWIDSVIEFGAGTGQNIKAMQNLMPNDKEYCAVEINRNAAKEIGIENVIVDNALDAEIDKKYDLAFCKGLAIHIHPDELWKLYKQLYNASQKYILICEYYNPTPVEVEYRGHTGKLWKRDFCGEMMSIYPDLELIDYGFTYYRDKFPQDDLTWFLMLKV